jgi:protein-disulfide isomerase
MKAKLLAFISAAILSSIPAFPAELPPRIDKTRFAAYVRYAEAFTPDVKIEVGDPVPSAYQGYFRILVRLSLKEQVADRVYYVTSDGQHFISGQIWDINKNPFADTLERLPTQGPDFGPAKAPVTIVVFSDFQCPYCKAMAETMRENVPRFYPNDVKVIFLDFPLNSHRWARAAAEAAHCLGEQKRTAFWVFHDWIFAHQKEVTDTKQPEESIELQAAEIARQQGIQEAAVYHCIETHSAADAVNSSVRLGRELGVTETPTLFVNGRVIPGAVSWETLDTLIKMELNRPKEIAGPKSENCCEVTIPRWVPQ